MTNSFTPFQGDIQVDPLTQIHRVRSGDSTYTLTKRGEKLALLQDTPEIGALVPGCRPQGPL